MARAYVTPDEQSAVGQLICERDGRIRYVNDAFCRWLGYHATALIGAHAIDFIAPQIRSKMLDAADQAHRAAVHQSGDPMVAASTEFLHRGGWRESATLVMIARRATFQQPALLSCSVIPDQGHQQRQHHTAALSASHLDRDGLHLLYQLSAAAGHAATATEFLPTLCQHTRAYLGASAAAIIAWEGGSAGSNSAKKIYDVSGPIEQLPALSLLPAAPPPRLQPQFLTGQRRHILLPLTPQWALLLADIPESALQDLALLEAISPICQQVLYRQATHGWEEHTATLYREIFSVSTQPVAIVTADTDLIVAVNPAFSQLLGRDLADMTGRPWQTLTAVNEHIRADDTPASAQPAQRMARLQHADGRHIAVIVDIQPIKGPDGTDLRIVHASRALDIAPVSHHLADVARDSLTGLPHRATLLTELQSITDVADDFAVLLVDIDNFKNVNDFWGHDVGDLVLRHVAQLLQASIRPGDMVARYGGDEFVIICRAPTGSTAATAAVALAERINTVLSEPIELTSGPVQLTVSVGISDRSVAAGHNSDLLVRADRAMYGAKRLGKNRYLFYDETLHAATMREQQIEQLLRDAIAKDLLVVNYQPIVEVATGEIVGVEALVRLIDVHGELVAPADFLPVASRTGMMSSLDLWVVRESTQRIAQIHQDTGKLMPLSVNLSQATLERPDCAPSILTILTQAGLPRNVLTIDISEPTLTAASNTAQQQIERLRAAGVGIAVDNFGAQQGSLNQLARSQLTSVKFDPSWMRNLASDPHGADTLEATTWLADAMGLSWSAGGVETVDQWEHLQQLRPGFAQGFLFSPPLSDTDLRTVLAEPAA